MPRAVKKPAEPTPDNRTLFQRRPILTWSSIAVAVPTLGVIFSWIAPLVPRYATEADVALAMNKVKAELAEHVKEEGDNRRRVEGARAWDRWRVAYNLTVVLRNRVNDCRVARAEGGRGTGVARAACEQYEQEFNEASRESQRLSDIANGYPRTGQ